MNPAHPLMKPILAILCFAISPLLLQADEDPDILQLTAPVIRHNYKPWDHQGPDYKVAEFSPQAVPSKLVSLGSDGRLIYKPYNEMGETLPDFSMAGYRRGLEEIPDVPVAETLNPDLNETDASGRILEAVARISQLPRSKNGFRGALLLKKGVYLVAKPIVIDVDGVVLRGEGRGNGGTTLVATGTSFGAYTFIHFSSKENKTGRVSIPSKKQKITDAYVRVGSFSFNVADASAFAAGDEVIVHRPSTAE